MLNLWCPRYDAHDEDWSVGFDESTLPWYVKVDYVEYHYYDSATDSFVLSWRDEFDQLDESKWRIQHDDSTFNESLSTYQRSQVYVEDSQLVLKLDRTPSSNSSPWAHLIN